jgi:hypothetical protein
LPVEIVNRKKQGAALAIFPLIRKNMDKTRGYFFARNSFTRSIMNNKQIERITANPQANAALLSRLYVLEVWKDMYFKKRARV